ncbi:MAG: hypothetical protein ACRERD_14600 [Candidatus Binatia bacterium]
MRTIKLSAASRSLAEYADELDDDILVLTTTRNRPIAAIVPLKNVDRESLALSAHPEFLQLIEHSRREFAAGKTLSLAQMRAALEERRLSAAGSAKRKPSRTRREKGDRNFSLNEK